MRRALVTAMVAIAACDPASAWPGSKAESDLEPLTVTRTDVQEHLLVTGVLDAAKSVELAVPRTDDWNLAIRWMAEDGAIVRAGDKVVEFENAAVVERILEQELKAIEADIALAKAQAETAVAIADKEFAVKTQQIAVGKAELEAALPEALQSRREHREASLALARAKVLLATAKDDLDSVVDGGRFDQQVKRIAFDKALRAYRATEKQLDGLLVTAPRDGMFTVGVLPWEDRKLQVGDNVWPGLGVGKLPDLSKMVVDATLSDVDEGRVQPGMRVLCTVDAYADRPLAGSVRSVSPVAHEQGNDSLRRFFGVVVELDETDAEILRPGLSVKIDVQTRHADDALVVPRSAIDVSTTPAKAQRIDGESVQVEVEFCTAQVCVVASGLDEGDRLLPIGAQP